MKLTLKIIVSTALLISAALTSAAEAPPKPPPKSPLFIKPSGSPSPEEIKAKFEKHRDDLGNILLKSVERGDLRQVENLLHDPIIKEVVNWQRPISGQTSLIKASMHGQFQMVGLLLNAGADPQFTDEQGKNALTYAVEWGKLEVASYLIHIGKANPNCSDSLLVKATQNRNLPMIKLLLDAKADPRGSQMNTGITPYIAAQKNGDDLYLDVANVFKQKVQEAHKKSEEKQKQKALLPSHRHLEGLLPDSKPILLFCLSQKNPAKIAQTLFTALLTYPQFRTSMQNPENLMKLFKALPGKAMRLDLARYFQSELTGGKIPFLPAFTPGQIMECKDKFKPIFAQNTPMHAWLKKTKDHLVSSEPLVAAVVKMDSSEVHKILANRYIDLGSIQVRNALVHAICSENLIIASMLLHAGVDPDLIFCPRLSLENSNGDKIIQHCIKPMMELILDFGGNPSYILPYAIGAEKRDLTALLLQAGANDQGAGLNPLMLAALAGDSKKVRFLLKVGINPAAVNPRDQKTAWDYAHEKGHAHIKNLLEKSLNEQKAQAIPL